MKKKLTVTVLAIISVLLMLLMVFTACDEEEAITDMITGQQEQLAAPTNFGYDGKYVTWDRVPNATSYLVSLNNGTQLEYNSTNCRYTNDAGDDFKVAVQAKADGYQTSNIAEYTFSALGEVTNLIVKDDGTLEWSEVDYADSYEVIVGSQKTTVVQPTYSDLPVGQSIVAVKAKRASEQGIIYYSLGKTTKTVTILADVDTKRLVYSEGTLSWGTVSGARYYELYINDQLEEAEVSSTKYDFDAHNGNFKVGIRAIGDHTSTFDSKNVVEKSFIYLESPTNVHVESGVLLWDEVTNAESYSLKLNGTKLTQTFTECKYTGLRPGETTRVQIIANSSNNAYYPSWTDEKSFLVLKAPDMRWVEGNLDGDASDSIVWDAVQSAVSYSVLITYPDGTEQTVGLPQETRAYGNAYQAAGEYTVAVKSLSDATNPNVCDSTYSPAIKVVRLAAPKAANSNFIKSYPDNVAYGFDVTFNAVGNASGYELWRDDTRVNSIDARITQFARVNDFVDDAVITEQIYTYRIKSIGSSYNSARRTKVLDSLSSETLDFDITVLAMPANARMEGYNITFDSVSKANRYTIDAGVGLRDSETTSYSLDFLPSGTYDIRVNARGNQSNILSSNYTVAINVVRLHAPENIRIATEGSEGVLIFDGDDDASSYELVINGEVKNVVASNVENIAKEITTSGTQMHLRAIRNDYDSTETHYYMTSPDSATKTFTKLPAPTFGTSAFSNTQLIWNAVSAFSNYSPTYKVYDDSNIAYNGAMNGATMDISYLAGGRSYNFKVKAIGNGTEYINSDLSTQRSIYKLATPNVSVNTAKTAYKWRSVSNTTSYAVYVDGVVSDLSIHNYGDEYEFTPKFTTVKEYKVSVIAKGDGGIETIDSDPCEITQVVQQLDTPDFTFLYTASTAGDGEIQMTLSKQSDYATGYVYIVKGVRSNETTDTVYSYDPNNVGSYPLSVYAIGGQFDENGIYYIDSQVCGGNANYTITLLAQPGYDGITLNRDGILSWITISGASAYSLTITVNSTDYVKTVNQGNTFDIAGMLYEESISWSSVTDVTVSIVAKGGNAKVVDSVATEKSFNNISH